MMSMAKVNNSWPRIIKCNLIVHYGSRVHILKMLQGLIDSTSVSVIADTEEGILF